MRIITTIDGEEVIENDDLSVEFVAKAAVDTDGSGPLHGDPAAQSDTSLHHEGKALNADLVPYIVTPPAIIHGVKGIVLGCQAFVKNTTKDKETDWIPCVVGDIGPHKKIGEVSVAAAKALGINPSPTRGGEDRHVIRYRLLPGIAATVLGVKYSLQGSRAV